MESALRDEYQFLQKDMVETNEGLVFAVVADGIEMGRVLSFLRYRRASADQWLKLDTLEANRLLRLAHADYLIDSQPRDCELHGIPISSIRTHYRPTDALQKRIESPEGPHVQALQRLTQLFAQDIEICNLGVTGSILLGCENAKSDIDLVVYGLEDFSKCLQRVGFAIAEKQLEALSQCQWREAYQRRACELSYEEYLWHELRKCNKFSLNGIKVDLACIDRPPAITLVPGRKVAMTKVRGRVTNDHYRFASPAIYAIKTLDGQHLDVIACTPTYAGQAVSGELIEACGWLEKVGSKQRLIVGSSREGPGEYIRVVPG